MNAYDSERAERFASAFPARSREMVAKHRARAVGCLAEHVCSTDMTDGFCGPEFVDHTMSGPVKCRRDHTGRSCVVKATSLMQAIESRGCTVVWAFDREMLGGSDG